MLFQAVFHVLQGPLISKYFHALTFPRLSPTIHLFKISLDLLICLLTFVVFLLLFNQELTDDMLSENAFSFASKPLISDYIHLLIFSCSPPTSCLLNCIVL
jgi:hypothetical protein